MKPHRVFNRSFLLLALISAVFLFHVSSSLALVSPEYEGVVCYYNISLQRSNVLEFNETLISLINSEDLRYYRLLINGSFIKMIELPSNSIAVKLPYERIALKFSNGNISILPPGSIISKYDGVSMIVLPDENVRLKISKVVTLPIENFTATAKFDQSINQLDTYKVKIVFNELDNPVLTDNVISYSVDWGDGNVDMYTVEDKTITHIYRRNGMYYLTFNISDCFGFNYSIKQSYKVKYEGHLLHTYFLIEENKEPIAVGFTGIGAFALALFALTETGKYKILALLPLLIPLYTRIQKEDVLDQFVRGQIYGYIKTNPGVHYNQIRRGIDIKNGTLSYHLRVLEKTDLIKSRREGLKYRAFYPTGMKFPEKERFRLTELQVSILDIIKENGGINQKDIADMLNKKPQTINYNIKVLEEADMIEVRKQGRKTVCYLKGNVEYFNKSY